MRAARRVAISIYVWLTVSLLIIAWFFFLLLVRLSDRDPVRYRTGFAFRKLGVLMTRINPFWRIELGGVRIENPRRPYVVVSNHQSMADIPVLSHVPWEMKWVAKEELFRIPVVGWMLRLAGDIRLNRTDRRSGARTLVAAEKYLAGKCSVILFPEGTRSMDGRVRQFSEGAFYLAIKAGVPVLPIAVDGSHACLPKHSFIFGDPATVRVAVLPPVETSGWGAERAGELRDNVRQMIVQQVAEWRGVSPQEIDARSSPVATVIEEHRRGNPPSVG